MDLLLCTLKVRSAPSPRAMLRERFLYRSSSRRGPSALAESLARSFRQQNYQEDHDDYEQPGNGKESRAPYTRAVVWPLGQVSGCRGHGARTDGLVFMSGLPRPGHERFTLSDDRRCLRLEQLVLGHRERRLIDVRLAWLAGAVVLVGDTVALLHGGVALASDAIPLLERRVALARQAIALDGKCVALQSSANAEPSGQLPLAGDLLDTGLCGVALSEHSVARPLRIVALGASLVAFTGRLVARRTCVVALAGGLRRQASSCSLTLGLGTQILDA